MVNKEHAQLSLQAGTGKGCSPGGGESAPLGHQGLPRMPCLKGACLRWKSTFPGSSMGPRTLWVLKECLLGERMNDLKETGRTASAWGPEGYLLACPPVQLPPSFSGAALQCDGNRRRAGANNRDISGQPGPIVASSCFCHPLTLHWFFVFLPPGRPASRPQCAFLACSVLSGWPGNV